VDPHEALRSIVGDLGRVSITDLQQRIGVPLDEYFVDPEQSCGARSKPVKPKLCCWICRKNEMNASHP